MEGTCKKTWRAKSPPHFNKEEFMAENEKLAIVCMLLFIVLDLVSGVAAAYARHEVESPKLRQGLWHKIGYLVVLFCSIIIEWAMNNGMDLGFSLPLVVPICVWISLMEVVSILENAEKINPDLSKIPGFERLKQVEKETREPKHKAKANKEEE